MNKTLLVLSVIHYCTVSTIYSQVTKIENTHSPEHIVISGTKYAMIIPDPSFSEARGFKGLQNEDLKAGVNIMEMPMAFDNVLPMFTKDLPPKNGGLISEKELIMNGYSARLYKVDVEHKSAMEKLADPNEEGSSLIHWLLLYGNESMSLVISGTYPSALDEKLSTKFERSLLSFLYLENEEADPLDGLSFSVNIDGTPLTFATVVMQTGVAYNLDGKFPSDMKNNTSYMIMVMPFPVEEQKKKDKAIRAVKKPTDATTNVKETQAIELGGLKGYEVIGYEKKADGEMLKYSITLFDQDKHYIINGRAKKDFEETLEMFRNVSKTFAVKK